jgi:hypothetical protein
LPPSKQTSTAGGSISSSISSSSSSSSAVSNERLQAVLSSAVGSLSGRLDELDRVGLVFLMSGCAAVEAASQDLGASILMRIEPELRCVVTHV